MNFRFGNEDLVKLYETGQGKLSKQFPSEVIASFFKVVAIIGTARDEREFFLYRGLRFEKLSGDKTGFWSMRLNKQFRLICQVDEDEEKCLVVLGIEDYHK